MVLLSQEVSTITKQEIGAILMKLREKSGKTREEVAELLGKSAKTVGHWETGYAQPDANTLFLLCTIYDADLNESFGFSSEQKNPPSTTEAAPGESAIELFNYINDALISMGFIKRSDDITSQQAEVILGVCRIIYAIFNQEEH